MHRDGTIVYQAEEYWPAEKEAQAVLAKFQPKHVWRHGDVFKFNRSFNEGTMIYLENSTNFTPEVRYVNTAAKASEDIEYYLVKATFLFNIENKL